MQPAKRAKVEQFVETTPQGRDGLRPQGSHLGLCLLSSKSLGKKASRPREVLRQTRLAEAGLATDSQVESVRGKPTNRH